MVAIEDVRGRTKMLMAHVVELKAVTAAGGSCAADLEKGISVGARKFDAWTYPLKIPLQINNRVLSEVAGFPVVGIGVQSLGDSVKTDVDEQIELCADVGVGGAD